RRVRRVPDPARLRPDRLSLPGRPGRGTIPLRRQERQYPGGELTAIDLRQVERVLVIMLRHHGDVLLTSPVFTALKRAAPQLEIDALVYADTSPMLLGHPAIAELHCVDRAWRKAGVLAQARGMARLVRRLSQRRYNLTINLTTHWLG